MTDTSAAKLPQEADVVVVGSGAGGAPVALTLARAGADVVVLDRGKRYSRRDFIHDEIRIDRRSFFVPPQGSDPHVIVLPGKAPERTSEGWISTCVGGGTVHMSGFFYRFHPEDFRVRTLLGPIDGAEHADWPIRFSDLEPYYAMAEREVGVSGPKDEGPHAAPRRTPYPLPPVDTHPAAALIDRASKKLGLSAFPTPRAIASRAYEGRGACIYCQLCGGFGCENDAKSSTLVSLLPAAEATGHCRIVPEAMVLHIESDGRGRATGVVVRQADGTETHVRAKVVVVAASAIESARLLLLSKSAAFPHGLANNAGQVGRYLMFSTLSKAHGSFVYATDAKRAAMLKDRAPFVGRSILDYYLPPAGAPVRKGGALNFLFPSGGPIDQSELLSQTDHGLRWGAALQKALATYWLDQRQIDCETFGEYLPTTHTRVELDPEVRDGFGLPVARMVIDRHSHDVDVSRYLAARAAEVLDAAGADRVWQDNIGGRTMHLPMGGCRMGHDPKRSVVNADGRAHEVRNLFVSDGSVFASSGGVPPTLTILANAFRVGARIRDAMAHHDL